MKKILVFSDTHGDINNCLRIIDTSDRVDAIIHAGDYTSDAEDLKSIYEQIPVYYVKGNNDIFSTAPSKIQLVTDNVKIYITHGHEQRVKYDFSYRTLINAVKDSEPNLVVFGHTHIPYTKNIGKMTLLNPGSTRYSHSYAVVEIEDSKLKTQIIKF